MIGFRVDANENIASGHIVRCITIAKEFVNHGYKCIFYLAEDKETWRLRENGLQYRILDSDWKNLYFEIKKMRGYIKQDSIEWLIVDSYQANSKYLKNLNELCKVAYMDDMGTYKYKISAVIHYGLPDSSYEKKYEKTHTLCLSGPRFIPLREEFNDENKKYKREKSILITTGGTDKYCITLEVLKKLVKNNTFKDYDIYTVIGSMNVFEKNILDFSKNEPRIHVLKNINNMSLYMKKSEFAISAGGTTLYELCACMTPTVCFSFADNQYEFAKSMEREGMMLYAGDPRFDDKISESIINCLVKFKENKLLINNCIYCMKKILDGRGARRIVDMLLKF